MDATNSDTIAMVRRRLSASLAGLGGLVKIVALVGLMFALVGATSGLEPPSTKMDEIARADQPADMRNDHVACDDSITCAPYIVSLLAGSAFLTLPNAPVAVSRDRPFPRFMSPQIDLPPPRTTA
ncbi:MAG: hypothetical protein COB65_11075 [Thalassobium sp.]|uniref:hypothetical protein n=1 Tax=Octadecabacter sp. SW4 TaxID=2602067 RepID=UPI000C10ECF6|nr:hypothetical protein [Octadecabacter sp. SW4]PHQ80604.1 MAG: hypothetical protein COB65_11075 [Thalassobium sp.]QEE35313.1 hypothetical protein FTO60_06085 [Octadecabacter sp. SW4]